MVKLTNDLIYEEKLLVLISNIYNNDNPGVITEFERTTDLVIDYFSKRIKETERFEEIKRGLKEGKLEELFTNQVTNLTTEKVEEFRQKIDSYFNSISIFSKPNIENISESTGIRSPVLKLFLKNYGSCSGFKQGFYKSGKGELAKIMEWWMKDNKEEFRNRVNNLLEEKGYVYWRDLIESTGKEIVGEHPFKKHIMLKLGANKEIDGYLAYTEDLFEPLYVIDYWIRDNPWRNRIPDKISKEIIKVINKKEGNSLKEIQRKTNFPLKYVAQVIMRGYSTSPPFSFTDRSKIFVKLDREKSDLILVKKKNRNP
ncbi:MAG: hypothetical protein Q7R52_01500 [archaeon]|nr:hypothetical protein [archaeon]